jgi:hypothetical protein
MFKENGSALVDVDNNIKVLEDKRKKFMLAKEETWRQKRRVIWL